MFSFGRRKEGDTREYELFDGPLDGERYTARLGAKTIREILGRFTDGRIVFVEYEVTAPQRAEFRRYLIQV